MIFYFSGTGNSKWVAEQVAERLGDQTVNMASSPPSETYTFEKGEKIGIVFPVYAWRAPDIVTSFVKSLKPEGAYTYAISTYGGEAGHTMKKLSQHISLNSCFGIPMPGNYLIGNMDSEAVIKEKKQKAEEKAEKICEHIKKESQLFDVHTGSKALLKSNLAWWGFNTFARKTKPFTVDTGACTGCGRCQIICPAKAISLNEKHPTWTKPECFQCLGCINRCPVCAIEYGNRTKGKVRYYFDK